MKTVGIQGGKGSFNHQGWMQYARLHGYEHDDVQFLYTTKQVLEALERGAIDLGHFAIFNSIGGLVEETQRELGRFTFSIIDWYRYPISHVLMKRKDISADQLTHIVGHPQVFKQCKKNLEMLFGHLICSTDEQGIRIDHARLAEELSLGMIGSEHAVIGPRMLAELYDFDIVAEHLEDDRTNTTAFVVVEPLLR